MIILFLHTRIISKPPFSPSLEFLGPPQGPRQLRGDFRAPVSLYSEESDVSSIGRDINTYFSPADFSQRPQSYSQYLARSCSNCFRYDTSEMVMILYYDVIDPAEGLTPPECC